jgi:hypothetical protein
MKSGWPAAAGLSPSSDNRGILRVRTLRRAGLPVRGDLNWVAKKPATYRRCRVRDAPVRSEVDIAVLPRQPEESRDSPSHPAEVECDQRSQVQILPPLQSEIAGQRRFRRDPGAASDASTGPLWATCGQNSPDREGPCASQLGVDGTGWRWTRGESGLKSCRLRTGRERGSAALRTHATGDRCIDKSHDAAVRPLRLQDREVAARRSAEVPASADKFGETGPSVSSRSAR